MTLTYNGVDFSQIYVANCSVCGARLRIEDDPDLCGDCLWRLVVTGDELDENGKISRNR